MSLESASTTLLPPILVLLAEIRPQIVKTRVFRSGRIDRFGAVVGVQELPVGAAPGDRQVHHLDDRGRVLLLEKFSAGVDRPRVRLYRYADWQVADSLWIDAEGRVENYHRYRYEPGTGLLVWRAQYDAAGRIFYSITSSYDNAGRLVSESWTDSGERAVKRSVYRYDRAGEIAQEERLDGAGQVVGTLRLKYDAKGSLRERAWHGPDGALRNRLCFKHDAAGRVVRIDAVGRDGQVGLRQEFTYDVQGNVQTERWLDCGGRAIRPGGRPV